MTTTYAAVQFIADGKPYVFSSDVTDGATVGSASPDTTSMKNVVSDRTLGDTFGAGARITSIGPVTLNSSDGTGASKSILGAVITDPQNNVAYQINWVDPETSRILPQYLCNIPVGLNFAMHIITSNT
jgi:hypothetical protein